MSAGFDASLALFAGAANPPFPPEHPARLIAIAVIIDTIAAIFVLCITAAPG